MGAWRGHGGGLSRRRNGGVGIVVSAGAARRSGRSGNDGDRRRTQGRCDQREARRTGPRRFRQAGIVPQAEAAGTTNATAGPEAREALPKIRDLLRPGNPDIDRLTDEQLLQALPGMLKALLKPAPVAEDFADAVKRALQESQARIGSLAFSDAAKGLDDALARAEAKAHDDARGLAALLAERGRVSRLQLHYREAAGFYSRAAEIASSFDPAAALGYGLTAADRAASTRATNSATIRRWSRPSPVTDRPWSARHATVRRPTGPRPNSRSATRSKSWANAKAERTIWSRPPLPTALPWKNGPGQACLWIGRGPRWGLASRWRRLASARAARRS